MICESIDGIFLEKKLPGISAVIVYKDLLYIFEDGV